MLDLDGSAGGGQLLRTALSLSACTGEAVRMTGIRGDRPTPGLGHQHLATLRVLGEICDATVEGDELGAETVTFEPGPPTGGHYTAEIDTAGSLTLLFDALFPLATRIDEPLTVTATGGTDVSWSPPIDFLQYVKLPLLRRFGLQASLEVDRRGFYPAGGGRATLRLARSALDPIELRDRGPIRGVRVYSTEAVSLAGRDVADRQAEAAATRLGERTDLAVIERSVTTVETDCPGSAIVLRVDGASGPVAGFDRLGEPGTPAERVGEMAADEAASFLEQPATVDRHLADQLLVGLALAGGSVRVPERTDHVETSLTLLRQLPVGPFETEIRDSSLVFTSDPA